MVALALLRKRRRRTWRRLGKSGCAWLKPTCLPCAPSWLLIVVATTRTRATATGTGWLGTHVWRHGWRLTRAWPGGTRSGPWA